MQQMLVEVAACAADVGLIHEGQKCGADDIGIGALYKALLPSTAAHIT